MHLETFGCILTAVRGKQRLKFLTSYRKWLSEERSKLIAKRQNIIRSTEKIRWFKINFNYVLQGHDAQKMNIIIMKLNKKLS